MPRFDPCVNADAMFYLCKCQFWEKIPVLLFEKFPFLVLARNMIMLQHLIIQFSLHHLSSGCLQEVKDKGKFQTFGSKSGCGRLREMVNHKRFQIIIIIIIMYSLYSATLLRDPAALYSKSDINIKSIE